MTEAGGDFRAGEPGYWSHWWEALQSRERSPAAGGEPLRMDVITDGEVVVLPETVDGVEGHRAFRQPPAGCGAPRAAGRPAGGRRLLADPPAPG